MYLGIDIGGTKTLVGVLDEHGVIKERVKFPTPENYDDFLLHIRQILLKFETHDFRAAGVGIPATYLDRARGIASKLGNLPWVEVPIRGDIKKLVNRPVVVENDTKLGGLSESRLLKDYSKILYVTISTGIGFALIVDGVIDKALGDAGGHTLMLEHDGHSVSWESFASGKAIVKRYGKRAEDIHDPKIWQVVAHDIALGLIEVIAMTEPDVIVIGGGVGNYLPRFIKPLKEALKHYENAMLPIPPIREAARPDDAVLYGCYDLAKEAYGKVHSPAV